VKEFEFNISGMSCESCVKKISEVLSNEKNISALAVSLSTPNIRFSSPNEFDTAAIDQVLAPLKKYRARVIDAPISTGKGLVKPLTLYWPLILLFLLSAGLPALNVLKNDLGLDRWMYDFMGITLVALSYFKLLDLPKFADGFSTYDPIASRFHGYGYVYPFLELFSGIAFLMAFSIQAVSVLVILFLSMTTYGVIRALVEKRSFQCACMGTVFKLPLTKITIIENTVMIAMAVMMLAKT
jgi:copper chaperone CopZ